MHIQFASCDVNRCEIFLKKAYPERCFDMSNETIKEIMRLIKDDVIRITDPDFHVPTIVPSKGFKEEMREELFNKSKAMHEYIMSCEKQ